MPLGDHSLTLTGRLHLVDQPLVVNEEPSRHDRGGEAFSTRAARQQNRWRKVLNVAASRAADTCGHESDGSAVRNWASPGVRNLTRSTQ